MIADRRDAKSLISREHFSCPRANCNRLEFQDATEIRTKGFLKKGEYFQVMLQKKIKLEMVS